MNANMATKYDGGGIMGVLTTTAAGDTPDKKVETIDALEGMRGLRDRARESTVLREALRLEASAELLQLLLPRDVPSRLRARAEARRRGLLGKEG